MERWSTRREGILAMRILRVHCVALLPLMLAAGQADAPPDAAAEFDRNAVRQIIEAKTRKFTEAHVTRDSAFLVEIFTPDARVYAPNVAVVTGRAAIARVNTEWLAYGITEFREQSTAFRSSGHCVVDEGTYFLRYGSGDKVEEGYYLNVWKLVDGDWKLDANMWTMRAPPPDAGM